MANTRKGDRDHILTWRKIGTKKPGKSWFFLSDYRCLLLFQTADIIYQIPDILSIRYLLFEAWHIASAL